MRFYNLILFACGIVLGGAGCVSRHPTVPAVSGFESGRYLGRWYEIARLPHSFERNMEYVYADYTLNDDGSIKIVNSGIRDGKRRFIEGVGRLVDSSGTGELKISFFRPFYGSYRVVALAPDYSSAVVMSGNSRDYLWILARNPTLEKETLQKYVNFASQNQFDTAKLEFPRQGVEKRDDPGYIVAK